MYIFKCHNFYPLIPDNNVAIISFGEGYLIRMNYPRNERILIHFHLKKQFIRVGFWKRFDASQEETLYVHSAFGAVASLIRKV